MSSEPSNNRSRPNTGRGSFRRRRPSSNNRGPRASNKPAKATGESTQKPTAEDELNNAAPKKERPASYSWPSDKVGKSLTGTVVSVIRKGKYNFGFISLSTAEDYHDDKHPRIYFNPSHVSTEGLYLRTGYQVQFTAENDEEGRSVAKEISLTEAGNKIKAERDEQIAKKRAERQQQSEAGAAEDRPSSDRRRRPQRRSRPPVSDGKKVTLTVTCEGKAEAKSVEANLGHSIGELRANAAALFDAPSNYGIYFAESFLNKAQFSKLNDNDAIHLAPRKDA